MAGLKQDDHSPLADALLLAALFIPFFPIIAVAYASVLAMIAGCAADPARDCMVAGFDLNALRGGAFELLRRSAKAGGSGALLLLYICALALLAQFTTQGFRSRVVRTCAVIMWAGVMPLVLGFANALAGLPPGHLCGAEPCSLGTILMLFSHLGLVFFNWLTNIAVPLGVMVSLLVALTMGYRLLIMRFVNLFARRD